MIKKFIISTDNTSDLPTDYIKNNELNYIPLNYIIDDVEYGSVKNLTEKEFYTAMRSGKMPKTAQITPNAAFTSLEQFLSKGLDVLQICFSSALSGTCNSFNIAAEDLRVKYPNSKLIIIDSLCASLGEGYFVNYAVNLRKEGKTIEEAAQLLEENKQHFCHFFTVDDLFHLNRGGRVSKLSAVIGSMLGIKPILDVNEIGQLIPIGKVRGRKNALDELVKYMLKKYDKEKCKSFYISHGDCYDDALYVVNQIVEKTGIKDYLINYVGPVIGSHAGPGTIALFFWGDNRIPS
ncbi:MAG: DegV family protein [Clostridia bacterium]|nr:DegV family protein [Clostridia bacterium]